MADLSTWIGTALSIGGVVAAGAAFVLKKSFESLLHHAEEELRAETQRQIEAIRGEHARDLERLRVALTTENELRRLAANEAMLRLTELMTQAFELERKFFHGSKEPDAAWPKGTNDDLNRFNDRVRQSLWLLPAEVGKEFDTYAAKIHGVELAKDAGPSRTKIWEAAWNAFSNLTTTVRQMLHIGVEPPRSA